MRHSRRTFVKTLGSAALLGSMASPLGAIDPIRRRAGSHMKLSLAAYSFRDQLAGPKRSMTLEDFVDLCADYGLDGTELTSYYFPDPVTPEYLHRLRRRAFLSGLSVSGTAIRNTFTHPPGERLNQEIAHVQKWVDYAAEMGAPVIRIFAGDVQKGTTEVQARGWCIDAIRRCCDYAGKRGVILGLENHGGIVTTADQILSIVRAVDSEWFGVNWDSGNFPGPDPYAALARTAPYAVTAQVKTEIASTGRTRVAADLGRIISILRDAGYRGFVALEYEADEDPRNAVPRHLTELRRLISNC